MKAIWVVIGVGILAGVVVTIGDYRTWRYEETKNYGHGPDVEKATWKLTQIYQNNRAKIRIRYPEGWMAETAGAFRNEQQINWPGDGEVVEFRNKNSGVKVSVRKTEGSLTDWENKFLQAADPAERPYGDRQVINTDKGSYTILTWQRFAGNDTYVKQTGLAKKGELLVVVEMESSLFDFKIDEVNFREMMKSLVML
jgi:hypothetical protein